MEQGDYTSLAKHYHNRAGYSLRVLKALACYIGAFRENFTIADIGAGTGKLAQDLSAIGMHGYCVEPNEAMLSEGIKNSNIRDLFIWMQAPAEKIDLPDSSIDWILMGSSFHWTNNEMALKEFHRILRPGGFFTALWNPRNLEKSELQSKIEKKIKEFLPLMKRISSGYSEFTLSLEETLCSTNLFDNLIYMEANHFEEMTKERYMGLWRSVNDLQAQAGLNLFNQILKAIDDEIKEYNIISVPYKTRSWTVQSQKGIKS